MRKAFSLTLGFPVVALGFGYGLWQRRWGLWREMGWSLRRGLSTLGVFCMMLGGMVGALAWFFAPGPPPAGETPQVLHWSVSDWPLRDETGSGPVVFSTSPTLVASTLTAPLPVANGGAGSTAGNCLPFPDAQGNIAAQGVPCGTGNVMTSSTLSIGAGTMTAPLRLLLR